MLVLGPVLGCSDLDMSSSVDDSLDRQAMNRLRSEEERERRRMRDRERRQSMTSEQKERHLARRRRNYQLRMQRVKHRDPTNANLGNGINGLNHRRASVYDPMSALQFSCYAPVGSGQALLKVHGECSSRPEGKESLAYDLTKLHRRLRLIHVKHFARSLKRPLGELVVNNVPILTDLIMKGNQVSFSKSVHGVRLNRIKQLARGRRSATEETSEHLPFSEAEGNLEKQNLPPVEDHQPKAADESRTGVVVA